MTRVLLVDDSPSARLALRRLLANEGFDVVGEANSGAEALRLVSQLRPDLVTMDVLLGGQDGVDVTRGILARHRCRVVIVTGLDPSRANLAFRAVAAGASFFSAERSAAEKTMRRKAGATRQQTILNKGSDPVFRRWLRPSPARCRD